MAIPFVALVGRPNVGKSTLFNRLIGKRKAIVEDFPGTTRDRLYGDVEWNSRVFRLIDTGGFTHEQAQPSALISQGLTQQIRIAIDEAALVLFVVDVGTGITPEDWQVADLVRRSGKPVMLVANKVDDVSHADRIADVQQLGFPDVVPVSGLSGRGSGDLLDSIVERLIALHAFAEHEDHGGEPEEAVAIRIAIVGRPNVGKSTLVNALLGRERMIVSDVPGTTRDAIDSELMHQGQRLIFIDTAGIRKRGKIGKGIERYSVARAHDSVDAADIVLVVIDPSEGLTSQDMHIIGYAVDNYKSVAILANKWDVVREQARDSGNDSDMLVKEFTKALAQEVEFVSYAPVVTISALTGLRVNKLLDLVVYLWQQRQLRLSNKQLADIMKQAVLSKPPPEKRQIPLRLFSYSQTGTNPPVFTFEVNKPDIMHFSYERYLKNAIRAIISFEGCPLQFQYIKRKAVKSPHPPKRIRDKTRK